MNLMQKYRDLMLDASEDTIAVPMTQARSDSLSDVMTATCDAAVKEIINIGKWTETDVTRNLEKDIVKVQKEVMSGRGKLIDFRQACQRWKAAGIK